MTYIFNVKLEARRGRREMNTKLFDAARDGVRVFAELCSLYWIRERSPNDPEIETRIVLVQADILVDVSAAVEISPLDKKEDLEAALDDLVRFGTGGDFQSVDRGTDLIRANRIVGAAARLRRELLASRRELLKIAGH